MMLLILCNLLSVSCESRNPDVKAKLLMLFALWTITPAKSGAVQSDIRTEERNSFGASLTFLLCRIVLTSDAKRIMIVLLLQVGTKSLRTIFQDILTLPFNPICPN